MKLPYRVGIDSYREAPPFRAESFTYSEAKKAGESSRVKTAPFREPEVLHSCVLGLRHGNGRPGPPSDKKSLCMECFSMKEKPKEEI